MRGNILNRKKGPKMPPKLSFKLPQTTFKLRRHSSFSTFVCSSGRLTRAEVWVCSQLQNNYTARNQATLNFRATSRAMSASLLPGGMIKKLIFLFLLFTLIVFAGPNLPKPEGFVNDFAGVLNVSE